MLTRLRLTNWQCHRDLDVPLSPITVLTGENDAGKSSVLRALRWVALNEWEGISGDQITWGEVGCEVVLKADGHTVTRSRSKVSNFYTVDGEELAAFGQSVPALVSSFLRMTPDNFQDQHDAPFWLMLTAGQASQELNEVFSLTAVDDALSTVGAEVRTAKAGEESARERLTRAEQRLVGLKWVDRAGRLLARIETAHAKTEAARQQHDKLSIALRQVWEMDDRMVRLREKEQAGRSLLVATEKLQDLWVEAEKLKRFVALQAQLAALRSRLVALQAQLAEALAGTCPLCGRSSDGYLTGSC